MSGSVVADFVAEALYAGTSGDEPTQTRVLLSEDQLVLASDEGRTVIDLEDVFDVVVSKIPEDLGSFFDQSVLVAYADGSERRTALVRGEHDRIDRFALFLQKAILRGHSADIRHPAREGGRVREPPLQSVSVEPTPDALRLRNDDVDVTIDLDDVTEITHRRRTIDGVDRPTLSVRHRADGAATTTDVYHDDANRLNVVARHLRSEYYRAEEILGEMDVADEEKRVLVALYAGVEPDALARVLDGAEDEDDRSLGTTDDGPARDAETLLAGLVEKDLVADVDSGALTHDGALVAVHRIGDVTE